MTDCGSTRQVHCFWGMDHEKHMYRVRCRLLQLNGQPRDLVVEWFPHYSTADSDRISRNQAHQAPGAWEKRINADPALYDRLLMEDML